MFELLTKECVYSSINFRELATKEELWIGDRVWVRSKNLAGRYDGPTKQGQAIVKYNNEFWQLNFSDLEYLDEIEEEEFEFVPEEKENIKIRIKKEVSVFDNTIDLHYAALAPDRLNTPHDHIIAFQLEKCKEYLDRVTAKKFPHVRIIHGKGAGKLKSGVEHLLSLYKEVYLFSTTPDQGAVEVYLQYPK